MINLDKAYVSSIQKQRTARFKTNDSIVAKPMVLYQEPKFSAQVHEGPTVTQSPVSHPTIPTDRPPAVKDTDMKVTTLRIDQPTTPLHITQPSDLFVAAVTPSLLAAAEGASVLPDVIVAHYPKWAAMPVAEYTCLW